MRRRPYSQSRCFFFGPMISSVVALQTDLAKPWPAMLCLAAAIRSIILWPDIVFGSVELNVQRCLTGHRNDPKHLDTYLTLYASRKRGWLSDRQTNMAVMKWEFTSHVTRDRSFYFCLVHFFFALKYMSCSIINSYVWLTVIPVDKMPKFADNKKDCQKELRYNMFFLITKVVIMYRLLFGPHWCRAQTSRPISHRIWIPTIPIWNKIT